MSTNTIPFSSDSSHNRCHRYRRRSYVPHQDDGVTQARLDLQDRIKDLQDRCKDLEDALRDSFRIYDTTMISGLRKKTKQSTTYPSHSKAQRSLFQEPKSIYDQFQSSLSGTQYHDSDIGGDWTRGDSAFNRGPLALGASPGSSGLPLMEPDCIHALDPDNRMDVPPYLSLPAHLEGRSSNLERFFNNSFPELSMTHSTDDDPSQWWMSFTSLPQSPDAPSSNGSSSEDYFAWANKHAQDHHVEPSSSDIQNHAQNPGDVHLSNSCGRIDLHLPTPSRSEERSGYASLNDTSCPGRCRWDGGCLSVLTVDRSEVMKHLQLLHGVKSGGDKDKMPCHWDGCGKEMQKENISRHIVTVHLSDKTKCASCGKQFTRSDSKLRHLKVSKRKECRESEPHDSRAKRLCLSWP
ncbi:hypothetical protein BDR06DRAFT_996009 [Suillus hirtellus]|nr:hypothetical protein BDR06DRAFT_996009 [Suillus hirtellus]